jgi:hypothetical protein
MKNNSNSYTSDSLQMDLMQNKYHFFNQEKAKSTGYYPEELVKLIRQTTNLNRKFKIEVGEIYSVRAFFAISKPIGNEVGFESGYLDLKLIMKENDSYVGVVVTTLPPVFVLKKGSKVKLSKDNILYKPNYKS